jgi:DTW domain-containing protein YfiP
LQCFDYGLSVLLSLLISNRKILDKVVEGYRVKLYTFYISQTDEDKTLHFILLDGTWNNSAAMLKRLKDHAKSVWGDEDLPCISLATGASAMHKLR